MGLKDKLLHVRFIPALIAGVAVTLITYYMEMVNFDIVLITSIAASITILTYKYRHQLTILGTTVYSYLIALITGGIGSYLRMHTSVDIAFIIGLVITLTAFFTYLIYSFHPPAIGIASGITIYKGSLSNLAFVISSSIILFICIKLFMYSYYEHLTFNDFVKEVRVWEHDMEEKL